MPDHRRALQWRPKRFTSSARWGDHAQAVSARASGLWPVWMHSPQDNCVVIPGECVVPWYSVHWWHAAATPAVFVFVGLGA